MYISSSVISAVEADIARLNTKFIADKKGIPKRAKITNDKGRETAKVTIEVKIIKATYALKAMRTPPFLS